MAVGPVDELGVGLAAVLTALTGLGAMLLRWHQTIRRDLRRNAESLEATRQAVTDGDDDDSRTLRRIVDDIQAIISADHADRDRRQSMLDERLDEQAAALQAMATHVAIRHDEMVKVQARLDHLRESVTDTRTYVEGINRMLWQFAERLEGPVAQGDLDKISDEIGKVRASLRRNRGDGGAVRDHT